MIYIYIHRDKCGHIEKFKVMGHSEYAEIGQDIVCAAVSAIVQTAVMGVNKVADIDIEYKQKSGYASFRLPRNLSLEETRDTHTILETMFIGLKNIELQYNAFVTIEELEVS